MTDASVVFLSPSTPSRTRRRQEPCGRWSYPPKRQATGWLRGEDGPTVREDARPGGARAKMSGSVNPFTPWLIRCLRAPLEPSQRPSVPAVPAASPCAPGTGGQLSFQAGQCSRESPSTSPVANASRNRGSGHRGPALRAEPPDDLEVNVAADPSFSSSKEYMRAYSRSGRSTPGPPCRAARLYFVTGVTARWLRPAGSGPWSRC